MKPHKSVNNHVVTYKTGANCPGKLPIAWLWQAKRGLEFARLPFSRPYCARPKTNP
jgi:hypothetical protein